MSESVYPNWKAPRQDGELLIWPPPAELLADTRSNARTLSAESAVLQNRPMSAVRAELRQWLGFADDKLVVATGHQTELYHPGVWVKDVLINAAAKAVDGVAVHVAVDTDQPKHLAVRWPGETFPVTDDSSATTAEWSGLLASPTPAHVQAISDALSTAEKSWDFSPLLPEVLSSLRRGSLDETGLSAAVTNAEHELDWSLGLRHHAMLASPMFASRGYLTFVHHVLANAGRFAADYNAALADYRREAGISSDTRPMPDLAVKTDTIEVPFWLDDLVAGTRRRAVVSVGAAGPQLQDKGGAFELSTAAACDTAADQLGQWLRDRQLRLSPRALTLTTFLRLLVVDQFVHGIGGGRYDQVTDRMLSRFFGITPPRFAVTTATLYFPGAVGRSRVCMPCLVHEGHQLKHRVLGEKKLNVLAEIDRLPRRSVQRSLAFHNMHSALATAAANHPSLTEFNARFKASEELEREEKVLFDRELFYACQTRQRLGDMIERYETALAD